MYEALIIHTLYNQPPIGYPTLQLLRYCEAYGSLTLTWNTKPSEYRAVTDFDDTIELRRVKLHSKLETKAKIKKHSTVSGQKTHKYSGTDVN